MKTTKLFILLAAAGLAAAACEKPETEIQPVAVESVTLDESIAKGITLTEGETKDISGLVTVLPENADDKTVTYSSDKASVAEVSEKGIITAVAEGDAVITVTAGEKTAELPVKVNAKPAGTVAVESVTLDESIAEGYAMKTGETFSIAELVTVLPENATDKSVKYSSSNEECAMVSETGLITAVAEGTAEITVTSASDAEASASFTITVNAGAAAGTITSITAAEVSLTYTSEIRAAIDLNEKITVEPAEYEDELVFSSSDVEVVTVAADGKLTVVAPGKATVTVSAKSNPETKAEITVTVNQYTGDYPRFEGDADEEQAALEGENWYWTMTASQDPLPNVGGRNNSLTGMIDGRAIENRSGKNDAALSNGTAFCLCCPGRETGGVNLKDESTTDYESWFMIDMGKAQKVNYFRISNISTHKDDILVRYKGFAKILGSNDGETFTVIAENVTFENAITEDNGTTYNRETANISIKESNYRYLKFCMLGTTCYGPLGKTGGSAQIEEFYLGYQAE